MQGLRQMPSDLRACLLCGLVKTLDQFELDGCDNCESRLGLQGSPDRILDCTTTNFFGYGSPFLNMNTYNTNVGLWGW